MNSRNTERFAGTSLVALLALLAGFCSMPTPVRIVSGFLMVFVIPGFALVCTARPRRLLTLGEKLLASVGISLAITVWVAVLLGASPIGLSHSLLAAVLGGGTLVVSLCGWLRTRLSVSFLRSQREVPFGPFCGRMRLTRNIPSQNQINSASLLSMVWAIRKEVTSAAMPATLHAAGATTTIGQARLLRCG